MSELNSSTLIEAIEGNQAEVALHFGRLADAVVHSSEEITWFLTGVPHLRLNGVVRTRLAGDGADARIEATLAMFRSRQVPMYWMTAPGSQPADLGSRLQVHGFTYAGDLIGMAADLRRLSMDASTERGLDIGCVQDVESLKRWLVPFAIGFGWPECVAQAYFDVYASIGLGEVPLLHFVGCVHGEPVATSSLFLDAGVAGLYNVACVPEHRCRGYGTALALAALRDARARGCAGAVLHSTEQGKGLYRRIGFGEYCRLGIYVLEAGGG